MRNHTHEVEMLQLSKSSLQRSHDQIEGELTAARAEVTSLKGTVSQMAADSSAIQCQLEATKVSVHVCERECVCVPFSAN